MNIQKNARFLVKMFGVAVAASVYFTGVETASALDFHFSGLSASIAIGSGGSGNFTGTGTFRINDAAIPSNNLSQADFLDWKIELVNSNTNNTTILYGDGGGFGVDNSDILQFSTNIEANTSTLDFSNLSGTFCIRESSSVCDPGGLAFSARNNQFIFSDTDAFGRNSTPFVATANAAVPFDFSPNFGFLLVGGIWGISHLRTKIKA